MIMDMEMPVMNGLGATRAIRRLEASAECVNGTDTEADVAGGYNNFWFGRGSKAVGTRRTLLIEDHPDERIPALLPEAEKRKREREWMESHATDGPEGRSLGERCIPWTTAGRPCWPDRTTIISKSCRLATALWS